jgi:hypothetical protein
LTDEKKILDDLINETWQEFEHLKNLPETASIIVADSMPVLWFGDLPAYKKSNLRLLTISKNPSDAEFGDNNRFFSVQTAPSKLYKTVLNQYFQHNPNRWFNQLAKFLPVFTAGYVNAKNTAIHVDLFTPIATNPVWPGLKDKQQYFDMKFDKLVKFLQPDVILTSLSAMNLKILLDHVGQTAVEIFNENEPGKSAKYIKAYKVDNRLMVINGRNFQGTYFGGMSAEFVNDCLRKIREML